MTASICWLLRVVRWMLARPEIDWTAPARLTLLHVNPTAFSLWVHPFSLADFCLAKLWGIANRGDYDLSAHAKGSGADLSYTDPSTNEKFVPFVIEPAVGVNRLMLALLCSAFFDGGSSSLASDESKPAKARANVLGLHPDIAPVKYAVLPIVKKQEVRRENELSEPARLWLSRVSFADCQASCECVADSHAMYTLCHSSSMWPTSFTAISAQKVKLRN